MLSHSTLKPKPGNQQINNILLIWRLFNESNEHENLKLGNVDKYCNSWLTTFAIRKISRHHTIQMLLVHGMYFTFFMATQACSHRCLPSSPGQGIPELCILLLSSSTWNKSNNTFHMVTMKFLLSYLINMSLLLWYPIQVCTSIPKSKVNTQKQKGSGL